jgi:oligoendopeptidase F
MKPMLALGVVVCMSVAILGQERDRAKVADKFKWNLADLYPTDAAWRTAKNRTTAEIPKLQEFQGALGTSAKTMADALEFMSRLDKELSRQYVYASMQSDLDTRQSGPQGMQQEMQQTYATFGAAAS